MMMEDLDKTMMVHIANEPNYYLNGERVRILRELTDGYVLIHFLDRHSTAVFRRINLRELT
jgi:hypothetical protein